MAARLFFAPCRLTHSAYQQDTEERHHGQYILGQKGGAQDRPPAAINKNRRSRVRTYVRQVEEALASGDKAAAEAAFKAAQPELMRAATKGVLHSNTASRKVSRLAQRVSRFPPEHFLNFQPMFEPGARAGFFVCRTRAWQKLSGAHDVAF